MTGKNGDAPVVAGQVPGKGLYIGAQQIGCKYVYPVRVNRRAPGVMRTRCKDCKRNLRRGNPERQLAESSLQEQKEETELMRRNLALSILVLPLATTLSMA